MATTYNDNGGSVNGSNKNFTFTFPYLKTQDVKVSLNGLTQATTKYTVNVGVNPTRIEFNNNSIDSTVQESSGAPKTGVTVRVYRDTDVDSAKAVYAAGSSIRAQNLNDNQDQVLYALQEEQNQPESLTDADINPAAEIQVSKLKDGTARQVLQTASNGTDVEWTSNVDIPGTLDVTSNAQFDGNVDITGTTTVGGTVNSAAIVTGPITGSNNLNVHSGGTTTFFVRASDGKTEIAGDADIDGTLTVGGTANSAAVVTGAITGSNNLNIKNGTGGATKFFVQASNGNTTVHGNLDVAGTFEVTGTSQYTGQQTVPGGALVKNIEVGLDADNEVSTTSGNLVLDSAGGTVQITDHLNVTGNADVDSNLNVDGTSTLTGNTTIGGTLTVTGTTNLAANSIGTAEIAGSAITSAKIADNQIDSEHYKDLSIDAEHVASNAITAGKLATDAVETVKIKDHNVTTAKIADAAVTTGKIENDAVTIDKISDNVIVTETEQAAHSVDNNHFFTTAAAEARFFNASTGETIKDGQSFPDNDTTIATTAAINDRIIDLVDDVGGFVPIANETSFPNANPDVNNGTGTLVSIKALSSNLTSNGSGVATITNGTVGNSTVTINGLANSTTYNAGYGLIVETTSTLNTYSFHRQVPKATEVTTVAGSISNVNTVAGAISNVNAVAGNATNINAVAADATDIGTVAGKATEIGRLGTADAVSDMNTLGTTAIVSDMDTLADISSNITTVAGISSNVTSVADNESNINSAVSNASNINSAVSNASNINSAVSNASNINTVAGISSNVTTVAGISSNVTTVADNNANVTTVASNMGTVNDFAARYRTGANNPTTSLDVGDLFFNTSANELKVYNGSAWQGGVTATGNFASITGNTFTGDNLYNDNIKLKLGTGSDIQIYHDSGQSYITNNTGNFRIDADHLRLRSKTGTEAFISSSVNGGVELYYDNVKKFETTSSGASVTGHLNIPTGYSLQWDDSHERIEQSDGKLEFFTGNGEKMVLNGSYLEFPDNGGLKFGTGDDLHVYHDGSNSYISELGTGDLIVNTNGNNIFFKPTGNETGVKIIADGAVELYYDGSQKLETTSTGATITPDLILNGSGDTALRWAVSGTNKWSLYNSTATLKLYDNVNSAWRVSFTGANIDIPDSTKVRFGTGNDLDIYHNGTNSYLENSTGNLIIDNGSGVDMYINSGNDIYIRPQASENGIKVIGDAGVELYYDNSKKLETASDKINFYAHAKVNADNTYDLGASGARWKDLFISNDIDIIDNGKLLLGTGNDLEIYHDGTNSYVNNTNASAHLVISSAKGVHIKHDGEDMIKGIADGAVELYYDNSKKFETHSGGINVTGSVNPTGNVALLDNSSLKLGTGDDLQLYHDGTNNIIRNVGTRLDIIVNSSETAAQFHPNGQVKLYYDNAEKFATNNTGIEINSNAAFPDNGKAIFGASDDLLIYHDGSDSYIYSNNKTLYINANSGGSAKIQIAAINSEKNADFKPNGPVELYYDNSKKFETVSGGAQWFGDLYGLDTEKLRLGSGNDLDIYHDGSHSHLEHKNTGNLYVLCKSGQINFETASETMAQMIPNGAVKLYYDNTERLATNANGIEVNGHVWLGDGEHVKFGAGTNGDLRIYHDGSYSYIQDAGTGGLRIDSDAFEVLNAADTEYIIKTTENNKVELYYDGVRKFYTDSDGVVVQGNLYLTTADDHKLYLGDGSDLQIWHSGSHNYIKGATSGQNLYIQNTNGSIHLEAKINESSIWCGADGDVELYYDGTKKFETRSTGLKMWGDGGGDGLFEHDNDTTSNNRYFEIRHARSGNGRGRTAGIWIGENSNSQGDLYCRSGGGNADVSGGVRISNGSSSWSTVSDMRLKDKTGDITNALVDIAKIEAIKFTWKADADKTPQVGVSAQSVENVVPEAISKNVDFDLEKKGDTTEYLGVRYTELVPLCIAALQEAKIKIETLETKVAALESS